MNDMHRQRGRERGLWWRLAALIAALTLIAAACGDDDDEGDAGGAAAGDTDLSGQSIEVAAVWTGTEQERFEEVIAAFEESTGADVTYTPAGDDIAAFLGPRISGGSPPDVAVIPQPALIEQLARDGSLQPIEDVAGDLVDEHYAEFWRDLATVDDELYGVWFKAANKSLMWYNATVFEDAGVEPPDDWAGLGDVAQTVSDFGVPAFSVGGADGWTLTDWFENVYIRTAGADVYDQLTRHEIPWTHESVKEALRQLGKIWTDDLVAGGLSGAVQTDFPTSVSQVFTDPARAAIVFEGDFVGGVISGDTDAELGEDADVFDFPEIEGSGPAVITAGDAAVLLSTNEAAKEFMRYLASPESAEVWAAEGGFIAANADVDSDAYGDDLTRRFAEALHEAGDNARFDMSDLVPTEFGGTPGRGLFKLFQDFLADPTQVDAIAEELERAATEAES